MTVSFCVEKKLVHFLQLTSAEPLRVFAAANKEATLTHTNLYSYDNESELTKYLQETDIVTYQPSQFVTSKGFLKF